MSTRQAGLLLALALAVHAGLALHTMSGNSATFDEGTHLPAGYTHLALGDHRLNPEQPPLVKILAAAPLLAVDPEVRTDHVAWTTARQWEFGRRFLYSWNDGDRLLFLGRLPMVALTLVLIAAIFLRTRRLAGGPAAAIALGLAALSPDLLAHGNLVTTDVGLGLFVFLAVAAFDHLTRRATWGGLLLTGLATGAALSTKFSGLVLGPVLLVLGAVAVGGQRPLEVALGGPARVVRGTVRRAGAVLGLLAGVGAVALLVIWASYGFRGALSPDPAVRAEQRATLEEPHEHLWQRALVAGADVGVVPEDYARGLLFVMAHSEGRRTFLAGRLSDEGFAHYFLATFLLKTPIPLLVLIALALVRIPRLPPRTVAFVWVPIVIYGGFALGRGLQIGHRHLLPVLPFLLVAAGEAASALAGWRRPVGVALVVVLAAWYAGGTLRNHPHHLAYFNEAAGGPANGWRVLVDSNLDWGRIWNASGRGWRPGESTRSSCRTSGAPIPRTTGSTASACPGIPRLIRPGSHGRSVPGTSSPSAPRTCRASTSISRIVPSWNG